MIAHICSLFCVNISEVILKLRSVLGVDAQALLSRYGLLKPFLQQMLIESLVSADSVSEQQLDQARIALLNQSGFSGLDEWTHLISQLGCSEEDVLSRLRTDILLSRFVRANYSTKAESRFLERKNELDQVVYSLLRLENRFLARELYLQIEAGESNFADLARRFAQGPERNTNGIVGPISLAKAHPNLVEKLRVARVGELLEPFCISNWWLVVRLERFAPSTFTDDLANQMCRELFDSWLDEQINQLLHQLKIDMNDKKSNNDFTDFSISL